MSSPLSNLKKSRKTPFGGVSHGGRNVPFRTQAPDYSEDEGKLLDEITSSMANQKLKDLRSSSSVLDPLRGGMSPQVRESNTSHRSTPIKSGPNDNELLGLMMTRLTHLEQRLQHQAKDAAEKDKKIKILEEKLKIMQKSKDDGGGGRNIELEKKCLLLQQQIYEMETFLSDYGMMWVGEYTNQDTDVYNEEPLEELNGAGNHGLWEPEKSFVGYGDFQMDYDAVIKSVAELNALAGDGIAQIQKTSDGARLKMQDPVKLTLYANGILMFSGPFRPFTDQETQACMKDLMDGYFPSELQAKYPDGVPFAITDKRNIHFQCKRADVFKGSGQVLGGDTKPSRLVPSNLPSLPFAHSKVQGQKNAPRYALAMAQENKSTMMIETEDGEAQLEVESHIPGPTLTVDQFLNQLPKSVMKEGKVIDIRSSVGENMKGFTSSPRNAVSVIETDAVKAMKSRLEISEEKRPPSAKDLTTLRIKSEKGEHTYILKMKFDDTIGQVRSYLDQSRTRGSGEYHIMSAFPKKTFDNDSATLRQCGLIPNAALHLKEK